MLCNPYDPSLARFNIMGDRRAQRITPSRIPPIVEREQPPEPPPKTNINPWMAEQPVARTPGIYAYIEALTGCLQRLSAQQLITIAGRLRGIRDDYPGIVYVLGNGGSSANASHLVLHLREAGMKAVDLMGDAAHLSALSNDHSYQEAPRLRLRAEATQDDVLVVISGSGNSVNVLVTLAEASSIGMFCIGLLGFGGGSAKALCDEAIVLESKEYGPVEDAHSAVIHIVSGMLRKQQSL